MPDPLLIALNRKLQQTDDPDKAAAYQSRIDDLEGATESPAALNRHTKAELVEMADDLDVDTDGMTKAEIIEALGGEA